MAHSSPSVVIADVAACNELEEQKSDLASPSPSLSSIPIHGMPTPIKLDESASMSLQIPSPCSRISKRRGMINYMTDFIDHVPESGRLEPLWNEIFSLDDLKGIIINGLNRIGDANSLRGVYLKSTNITEILPGHVILHVLSFMESGSLQIFPYLNQLFASILAKNSMIYNEMGYQIVFNDSRANIVAETSEFKWTYQAAIDHKERTCHLARKPLNGRRPNVFALDSFHFPWTGIYQWVFSDTIYENEQKAGHILSENDAILERASKTIQSMIGSFPAQWRMRTWPTFPDVFHLQMIGTLKCDLNHLFAPRPWSALSTSSILIANRLTVLELIRLEILIDVLSFRAEDYGDEFNLTPSGRTNSLMISHLLRHLTSLRVFSVDTSGFRFDRHVDEPFIVWRIPASIELIQFTLPTNQFASSQLRIDLSACTNILGIKMNGFKPNQIIWPDKGGIGAFAMNDEECDEWDWLMSKFGKSEWVYEGDDNDDDDEEDDGDENSEEEDLPFEIDDRLRATREYLLNRDDIKYIEFKSRLLRVSEKSFLNKSIFTEMNHLQWLWNEMHGTSEIPRFYRQIRSMNMVADWINDFFRPHRPDLDPGGQQ